MPGIVGLVTRMPRKRAEAELRRMVNAIRHESFYVTGTWVDESLGVYVGWAIPRNSFSDGLPIVNERGDVVLAFSGEEFPEPGTRRALEAKGHAVEPHGPSYLVHMYEDDPTFPANLNGRFQGLLADRTRETVTLFNDRFGLQRVYCHEAKDGFYFAPEAKAILAVRPELRAIDPRGMGEFVACGCVLENRTLFPGLHVLPGASVWTFRNAVLERKATYFQVSEWENQPPLEPEAYYQELREVFSRNLPRYFEGREKIGMSLTGGLDTRMVMAWQTSPAGTLPSYTFGGMFRDCQDVIVARRVASACGQSHVVIPAGQEFLSQFAHYAERSVYLTDGCVDVGRSPDLYINEKAREIAPVRMTGLYGGEVLRHIRAFKPVALLPGLFSPALLAQVGLARETYAGLIQCHPLSFSAFRQAPWHHYGSLSLEQTQLAMRSPFLDNDVVRTHFRAPASACAYEDVCLRLIADGSTELARIRTDRGIGGSGRLSAAVTHEVLEFLFKAEYAYDYGMPQFVARIDHALAPLRLQRLFLGRHKPFHFRVWYRDVLPGYVRDMLLDPKSLSRPHVERKQVETVVNGHLKGNHNYTLEIHKLLTLELVHRLFVDAQPSSNNADVAAEALSVWA